MRRLLIMAILTFGLLVGPSTAQVSLDLLSNSADHLERTEGQVEFDLEVHVDTTIDLDGLVFGLWTSHPQLFVLGDPPVVIGDPFNAGEVVTAEPVAGMPIGDGPEIGLFKASGKYAAAEFSGPLVTFRIRSAGPLPAGTSYSFTTGDNGSDILWTSSPDFGEFERLSEFTLSVVEIPVEPEPEPEPVPEPELSPEERLANLIRYLRVALVIWMVFMLL